MATSAEILARLRQEAEWSRNGAWQQTPQPTPTPPPIPVSMGRPQTQVNNAPATQYNVYIPTAATPSPRQQSQRNPTPTPTLQEAATAYQKTRYDPLSSATAPTVAPRPSPAQTPYRNPYPAGSMSNPAPTRPMAGPQPAPNPVSTPAPATRPTTTTSANGYPRGSMNYIAPTMARQGRFVDRGQGFPTAPTTPAPLYTAEQVLLDYLRQNPNDAEFRNRLINLLANPISTGMVEYEDGRSMINQGGPRLQQALSDYTDTAGQQFPSIWQRGR